MLVYQVVLLKDELTTREIIMVLRRNKVRAQFLDKSFSSTIDSPAGTDHDGYFDITHEISHRCQQPALLLVARTSSSIHPSKRLSP